MVGIPILETPRLRLRAHALADFPACAAMRADPAVTRSSHRVAQNCGYRRLQDASYRGAPTILFERKRGEESGRAQR